MMATTHFIKNFGWRNRKTDLRSPITGLNFSPTDRFPPAPFEGADRQSGVLSPFILPPFQPSVMAISLKNERYNF
jgi:hypothetical protein